MSVSSTSREVSPLLFSPFYRSLYIKAIIIKWRYSWAIFHMLQFTLYSFSDCFEEKSWEATTGPSSIVVARSSIICAVGSCTAGWRYDCSKENCFGCVTEEEKERRSAWLGGGSRPGHLLLAGEDLTLSSSSWAGASGSPWSETLYESLLSA